jgi:hypothetical protein
VHGPLRGLAHEIPEGDVDGADGGHELPALARERRDAPHARVGQGEEIRPDALDAGRVLSDDEGRHALEDLSDRAHGFRTALRQERSVRLADPTRPASVVSFTMSSLTRLMVEVDVRTGCGS